MTKVVVSDNNIDKALKNLKIKVQKSGVPSQLKKKKFYAKPGEERREKIEKGKKNANKKNKKSYSNKAA